MAKRRRNTTSKVIQRRSQEGRGLGTGKDYKPELRIQDVASIGLATRILGWKTGRIHHFMSKLECLFFLTVDGSPRVLDIREQFPLDRDETLAIADQLGIRHPCDPKTREPIVMTTDFVITVGSALHSVEFARTIKYQDKLSSLRVMEKFEIERIYWTSRGVDWGIVTQAEVPAVFAANVQWVHSHRDLRNLAPVTEKDVGAVEEYVKSKLTSSPNMPLSSLTEDADQVLSLSAGTSLAIVRYLIANRRLEVDMNISIRPEQPLRLIARKDM
jgi:hypothetical protein